LGGTSIVTCWFVGADPQRELHGRFGDDTGGRWRHRMGIIALLAIRQQRRYPAIDHQ
jgi:hypothetical protein